jgi:hypothetical protein
LILDFKENLRLGGGPLETNQMFYRMEQCSVLGFCLIHKSADGVVHKDYFDFFSSILSHDSLFAKDCLRDLVTDRSFPRLTSLSIWSDCGPHFHSFEFAHTVLRELPEKLSIPVQWSFFGEYHGKSLVDGHFGLLSRWLSEGEKSRPVENVQSCIDLMREKLNGSNALKSDADKLSVHFRKYDRAERPARMTQLRLPRFSDYHCFTSTHQSGGWIIHGFTTSERVGGTLLAGKVASRPDNRKTKLPPRKQVTPAEQDDLTTSQTRKFDSRMQYFLQQGDVDALAILLSRLHL